MLDELDCATLTLKKLSFFKDMKEFGLSLDTITNELQKKYNEKYNSKSLFLDYIGLVQLT